MAMRRACVLTPKSIGRAGRRGTAQPVPCRAPGAPATAPSSAWATCGPAPRPRRRPAHRGDRQRWLWRRRTLASTLSAPLPALALPLADGRRRIGVRGATGGARARQVERGRWNGGARARQPGGARMSRLARWSRGAKARHLERGCQDPTPTTCVPSCSASSVKKDVAQDVHAAPAGVGEAGFGS